jgi:hypothetical protein
VRGDLGADWRPSRSAGASPLARDQATVPVHDGARGDQTVRSQPSREQPDQRGEDRPVGPVQPGPRIGPAQHGYLVPQHQELGVLEGRRPGKQEQPAVQLDEDEIRAGGETRMIMMAYS